LKQKLDRHGRTLKRHDEILEERERQTRQCALVLYGLKELDVQPPKTVKFEDNSSVDLLADTLPKWEEPDEAVHWTSYKRMGRFSPSARKPRPVLIEFFLLEEKHKLLKMSKQLRQNGLRLDDWLTELQQKGKCTLDAEFQTLKGKGYKPFFRGINVPPQRQGICVSRRTKQTLFHLLHRTPIVVLIAIDNLHWSLII